MNRLAELLIAIADRDIAMPAASFSWGGPVAASAELLSNRSSRGGEDARSGNPKGWDLIVRRGLTSRNGNWVRMHMISAAYGGLDAAGNLIPTPTAVNTGGAVRGFERQVERIFYGEDRAEEVRAARSLFKRLQARRAVLWLRTTTGGFHPASAEIDPATARPIYDASTFVTSVSLQGGIYYPRDGQWVKDPTARASASSPVPRPDFSGTYVPAVSSIGEPLLARIAGIGTHFAREIVARGPFTSASNFDSRMRAGRAGEDVAVTSELRAAMNAVKAAVIAGRLKWKD
jgi:hypothetical protein